MKSRIAIIAVLAMAGSLMVPVLPASGDTLVAVAFQSGKAVVQCANPLTGLTFPFFPIPPGLGTNKGKKCNFGFDTKNLHKTVDACAAVAVSDALKKGSDKPPVAAGINREDPTSDQPGTKIVSECRLQATGVLGPRLKTPIPNPFNGGAPIPVGPWCGGSQGVSGAGTLRIGPTGVPLKIINFDRLRFQSQGTNILVTASATKDNVDPPSGQTQAGPIVALVNARIDDHKILKGIPKSSCLTNNKNFKVDGVAIGLLMGNK